MNLILGDLVTENNRNKDSPEGFFYLFFPRSTPRGFRMNFVEKIKELFNHKTDFRSCVVVG